MERRHELDDAVHESRRADPDDEQECLVPEVAGRPEGEQDLHDARDQADPPELGRADEESDHDLEGPAQEQEEGEDRGQRLEGVLGMGEGGDADGHECDPEHDVNRPPPAVAAGRRHSFEQACGHADRSQQDGQRRHGGVVELEDDQSEDHPERPRHEQDPPERVAVLFGRLVRSHDRCLFHAEAAFPRWARSSSRARRTRRR